MNRRSFFKSLLGALAGLFALPKVVLDNHQSPFTGSKFVETAFRPDIVYSMKDRTVLANGEEIFEIADRDGNIFFILPQEVPVFLSLWSGHDNGEVSVEISWISDEKTT